MILELYSLINLGKEDKALRFLLHTIDEMYKSSKFIDADIIFDTIDVSKLPESLFPMLICLSFWGRHNIKNRDELIKRIKNECIIRNCSYGEVIDIRVKNLTESFLK